MATTGQRGRGGDGGECGTNGGGDGGPDLQEPSDVTSREHVVGPPVVPPTDHDPDDDDGGSTTDGQCSGSPEDSNDVPQRAWEDVEMYQGYTPLTDETMWTGQGAILTTTTSDEEVGYDNGGGGVFFADMSAFFQAEKSSVGVDEEASTSDASSNNSRGSDAGDNRRGPEGDPRTERADDHHNSSNFDFRSIADRALAALDREYHQVVTIPLRNEEALVGAPSSDEDSFVQNRWSTDAASGGLDELPLPDEAQRSVPSSIDATGTIGYVEKNHNLDVDHHFVADFSNLSADADDSNSRSAPANINVEAVQRAVHAIQSKHPGFVSHADEWERTQGDSSTMRTLQLLLATAPMEHAIIPAAPLKAFRRRTAKAVAATATLTRSATIAEALRRLDLLQSQDQFVIHVVGCDIVECQTEERVRAHFGPIVSWVGSYVELPRNLSMVLFGPNIPATAPSLVQLSTTSLVQSNRRLESAEIRCVPGGLYHESLLAAGTKPRDGTEALPPWLVPDLVVAFHAGIWGYSTWEATFEHSTAHSDRPVPWVITSYTIQEAEDDAEALEGILLRQPPRNDASGQSAFAKVWAPEWNPFASQQARGTATAPEGRLYRENAAWSCWKI